MFRLHALVLLIRRARGSSQNIAKISSYPTKWNCQEREPFIVLCPQEQLRNLHTHEMILTWTHTEYYKCVSGNPSSRLFLLWNVRRRQVSMDVQSRLWHSEGVWCRCMWSPHRPPLPWQIGWQPTLQVAHAWPDPPPPLSAVCVCVCVCDQWVCGSGRVI